jgi:hypothetical protein
MGVCKLVAAATRRRQHIGWSRLDNVYDALGYWAAAPQLLGSGSSRLDVGRDWAFGLCDLAQL